LCSDLLTGFTINGSEVGVERIEWATFPVMFYHHVIAVVAFARRGIRINDFTISDAVDDV